MQVESRTGSFALARYAVGGHRAGDVLYHERFLAHLVDGSFWVIVTPDQDMHVENVDETATPDVEEYRFKPSPGRLPIGMPAGAQVYAFKSAPTSIPRAI